MTRLHGSMRRLLGVLVGLGCVFYLGYLLFSRREAVKHALELDWLTLGLLLSLVCASHLQRVLEFDYMLRRLGVRETLREGFLLTGAALLLNYLPFSAGSVARAMTLRRKHSLSYTSYASALLIASIVNGVVAALTGLAAVLVLPASAATTPLLLVFVVLAGSGALVLCFPAAWAPRGQSRLELRAGDVVRAIALIRHRGAGLVVLAAVSLGKIVLSSLRLWLCFRALGVELSPMKLALLGGAAVLVSLVNLAPGNLGVRELLLGGAWGLIGGSPTLGMAAASLDRAVLLVYTVAAGVPGVVHVRRALARSGESTR